MIAENLALVKERIRRAAERTGRKAEDIQLVLVSKTVSVERIQEAYLLGERRFGENRVQELLEKKERLPADIEWHLIGHLQTNKVKPVIGAVSLIHSVDSLRLAEEIESRAASLNRKVEILIQVHLTREETKFGVAPADFPALYEGIRKMPHVKLKGLMTIGPSSLMEEEVRQCFRQLAGLRDTFRTADHPLSVLSMGMTNDFEMAVEEGATHLRLGTAIFGERKKDAA